MDTYADLMRQITTLEEKVDNLERRNRMLAIELDCQRCSKNFTPDEVADILRVTSQTIRNEIKRGKLHSYIIGDRYLIGPNHLKDYLQSIER